LANSNRSLCCAPQAGVGFASIFGNWRTKLEPCGGKEAAFGALLDFCRTVRFTLGVLDQRRLLQRPSHPARERPVHVVQRRLVAPEGVERAQPALRLFITLALTQ
jgi:hypothetical protein